MKREAHINAIKLADVKKVRQVFKVAQEAAGEGIVPLQSASESWSVGPENAQTPDDSIMREEAPQDTIAVSDNVDHVEHFTAVIDEGNLDVSSLDSEFPKNKKSIISLVGADETLAHSEIGSATLISGAKTSDEIVVSKDFSTPTALTERRANLIKRIDEYHDNFLKAQIPSEQQLIPPIKDRIALVTRIYNNPNISDSWIENFFNSEEENIFHASPDNGFMTRPLFAQEDEDLYAQVLLHTKD